MLVKPALEPRAGKGEGEGEERERGGAGAGGEGPGAVGVVIYALTVHQGLVALYIALEFLSNNIFDRRVSNEKYLNSYHSNTHRASHLYIFRNLQYSCYETTYQTRSVDNAHHDGEVC